MMLMVTTALWMAAQQIGTISPGGVQAIGPKQDDPRTMCSDDPAVKTPERGIIVEGGRQAIIVQGGREAIGPKQDDPRALAIGPKQDDPLKVGVLARPGDDNDPKASGGTGVNTIVVQGGMEAIGPKQDDPRAPLKVGVLARPGDDNDPKALACAPAKG